MDTSAQTIINKFLDEHYSEFLDRLATKIQEASTLPLVDYDALRHQAVLMQYVWEGVHQVQAVTPDSYLDQALALVTAAVNRANAATAAAEDINSQISAAEAQRVLAETARANAEDARAAAELLRVAAEQARVQAENTRGTNETDRQTQETARQTAESQRSSWFSTFRATVEAWYSNENDPNNPGIVQRWNSFITSATSWLSQKQADFESWFGATADSEGGVRKRFSTWFSGAQSDYQALNTTMSSNEQTRQSNETARQTAEGLRASAESDRAAAELLRVAAEDDRDDAETLRETAEGNRSTAEGLRDVAESSREDAEDDREDAETLRAAAETQRQTDYSTLMTNIAALYQQLLSRAQHPAQFGQDGYIYEWDLTNEQYVRTNHFWQKFDRFKMSKEFASIALMEAYDPTNLPQGEEPLEKFEFVLIKSTVDDPDNSKLYCYMGENTENDPDFERWHYCGDFSGAMGFTGKTPQLSIGTVLAGNPGTQPAVTITANGTDANGNPCFLINFTIPRGADGRGIASLQQIQQSNVSEGENIWRATFSDGATADLIVLNGAQGANAGIGEATATIDSGVGASSGANAPSVTINTGGTNANRIFSFNFHNLRGATFTPSVDANGNLSWTNDGGLTNPSSFNILSAIPLATQLQQGLMSDADKEKLDLLPATASSSIAATTAAALASGEVFFSGVQGQDGKWTLHNLSQEELAKVAYNYIKQSTQLNELSQLLSAIMGCAKITKLGTLACDQNLGGTQLFCNTPIAELTEIGFLVAFDSSGENHTLYYSDYGAVKLVREGSSPCYFEELFGSIRMIIAGQTPKYFIVHKLTVG